MPHLREHAVHHFVAIVQRELLRPVQVAEIRRKGRMLLWQIPEVAVRQTYARRRAELLSHLDVMAADLVAYASRARMQREPDGPVAILGQFNEVVATPEGSERETPVPVVLIGRRAGVCGEVLECPHAFGGRGGELGVVLTRAHRNAPLDARAYRRRCRNITALQGRPNGHHAAADVDPYGGRDDGALGGQHGPDRRALAVMAVGHDRDVFEDEWHRRGVEDLLLRRSLDRVPREADDYLVVDRFHHVETNGVQTERSSDAGYPRKETVSG